jgi:hypothetical protein
LFGEALGNFGVRPSTGTGFELVAVAIQAAACAAIAFGARIGIINRGAIRSWSWRSFIIAGFAATTLTSRL